MIKTGLNQNLIDQVRLHLMVKSYNRNSTSKTLLREFDSNGNVIRDHHKELDILVMDEEKHVLPATDISIFDGHSTYRKFIDEHKNHTPVIDHIALATIPPHIRKTKTSLTLWTAFKMYLCIVQHL